MTPFKDYDAGNLFSGSTFLQRYQTLAEMRDKKRAKLCLQYDKMWIKHLKIKIIIVAQIGVGASSLLLLFHV